MCRNIRTLHSFEPSASEDEVHAPPPVRAQDQRLDEAVAAVTAASRELLAALVTAAPPKDRGVEAEKARERSRKRFAV